MWTKEDKNKTILYINMVVKRLKQENIPVGNIDTITFVSASSYFGYSIGYADKTYEIRISDICLCDKHILYNTVIHEILHCCDDSFNHDTLWKERAKKANIIFNVKISTTATQKEMLLASNYLDNKAKYIFLDRNTHVKYRYYKMCKSVLSCMNNDNYKRIK